MKYKEAEVLCAGQKFAMEMPLRALPQATPHPDQEAFIWCKAPVIPRRTGAWESYPDREHVEIYISYYEDPNAQCRMSKPDCANCPVASAAHDTPSKSVTLTREQLRRNDLSAYKLNI